MRKTIIAGNWKMYKTIEEAVDFVEQIRGNIQPSEQVEAVICPPALYLAPLMAGIRDIPVALGAQTMHEAIEGAYTGEISPAMLQSIHVPYVILGHSERREYYNETDEAVNRKVIAAFDHNLTPIVCVGESLAVREDNQTVAHVSEQVEKALQDVAAEQVEQLVIAYEPIWAIGTGKTATAADANEVCGAIRSTIAELYDQTVADKVRIQYGGSVKPSNIEELLAEEHIDGALVGGASLDPVSFMQLVEAGANR